MDNTQLLPLSEQRTVDLFKGLGFAGSSIVDNTFTMTNGSTSVQVHEVTADEQTSVQYTNADFELVALVNRIARYSLRSTVC